MSYSELGTIRSISSYPEGDPDCPIPTTGIHIDLESGGIQGFGGLALDKKGVENFEKRLCETFGVTKYKKLVGIKCRVLRNFGAWNEKIVGIETVDKKSRFTIQKFRKEFYPNNPTDPLEDRLKDIKAEIERCRLNTIRYEDELESVKAKYKNWD